MQCPTATLLSRALFVSVPGRRNARVGCISPASASASHMWRASLSPYTRAANVSMLHCHIGRRASKGISICLLADLPLFLARSEFDSVLNFGKVSSFLARGRRPVHHTRYCTILCLRRDAREKINLSRFPAPPHLLSRPVLAGSTVAGGARSRKRAQLAVSAPTVPFTDSPFRCL